MNQRISSWFFAGLVALVVIVQSMFTVHQVQVALVVQLGKPVRPVTEPGLHFKIPFFQQVHTFDGRLQIFDQDPQEVLSSDKKNLRVDNFARWRIKDPLKFYQAVRTELGAAAQLSDIIYSNLREVLGQYTMMDIVSGRGDLMEQIRDQANRQAAQYGIEIVDVRIKRTDLPQENSKAVYRRMQTERERQAKQYRAQGEEEAVKIRAQADQERTVLLAEAEREAQNLRGEGDATAAAVYAEAFQGNIPFYTFVRYLESYRRSLTQDTTVVLGLDADIFQHLREARLPR